MAIVLKDRVKVTATTTGTGAITLGAAVTGYQNFSAIGDGNITYYTIALQSSTEWEVGKGTVTNTAGTYTLSRDTVLESSNAGSLVNFSAGTKDVFVTYPAERAVYLDAAGSAVTTLDIGTLGTSTANITTANITAGTVSTTPASGNDLVNKTYVDTLAASGIHFHQPVRVESPINLTATYNNGTAGVGATLTNSGPQAALVIDGITVSVADRVLVYEQTTQTQNGIYVVTDTGSGSTNWILTRSSDADTYIINSAAGLSEGSTVFVQQGATGAGETYTCNTSGTITFGTTNITFAQISSAQIYSAGTGLTLSGTQFSITNAGTAGTYGSASQVPVFVTNAQGQVTSVTNTAIGITSAAVSGLAASATTDTTNAANITSGTLPTARLSGSYTGITGVGTLVAGTWNGSVIAADYGGTGQSSYAVGDLLYAGTTTSLAKLADVVTGNALLSGGVGTAPAWGKIGLTTHVSGTLPVANGGTGATDAAGARTNLGITNYTLPAATSTVLGGIELGSDVTQTVAANSVSATASRTYALQVNADGQGVINVPWTDTNSGGTVTSVSGTGTVSGLTLTGTVTTSGDLALGGTLAVTPSNFESQTAKTFLAAPNAAAGVPSFRAIVASDIPTLNQNTTGTAANVTDTVAVANGGTGQTTYTNGQLLIGNTTGNTLAKATLTAGTGMSITNGAGAITITNSAPDQTVSLTGAGATSISGTYPSFTITSTNTTYGAATSTVPGLIELGSDTAQTVAANAVSTTASRSYALQVNASGQGVVNVPWTDTVYSLPAATSAVRGGIELGSDTAQTVAANAVTTTASRSYALQVNADGQGVVNVPWTDTVYSLPAATSTIRGGIELGSDTVQTVAANAVTATASRSYALQVNADGQGVVNVPWTSGDGDVTLTGVQTLTNKTISGGVYSDVVDVTGSVRSTAITVAASTIDCAVGNYFTKVINGATTFIFSSAPSGKAYSFVFELTQVSGAVTWPASVRWPSATAPTLTAGKTHLFVFITDNAGSTWLGAANVDYTS